MLPISSSYSQTRNVIPSTNNENNFKISDVDSSRIYNEINRHIQNSEILISVVGFSAQGYKNLDRVKQTYKELINKIADDYDCPKDKMAVLCGATPDGIGSIAYDTDLSGIHNNIGIVSKNAEDYSCEIHKSCSEATSYVPTGKNDWQVKDVNDESFFVATPKKLDKKAVFIAIGGGEVALNELKEALECNQEDIDIYIAYAEPAEIKHNKNGQPLPSVNDLINVSISDKNNITVIDLINN